MAGATPNASLPGSKLPDGTRLDSWKEIAVYMGRSLRTVQRWEKEQGLPVRRHNDRRNQGPVFAFKSEIDAWWEGHRAELENQDSHGAAAERKRPRWGLLGAGGLLAAAVVVAWNSRTPVTKGPDQPTLQRVFELGWVPHRVSPDGRRVTYMDSKTLELLIAEREGDQPARKIEGNYRGPEDMAWSPDSLYLALVTRPLLSTSDSRQVEILEVDSGERRILWKGHKDEVPVPRDWMPARQTILAIIKLPDQTARIVGLSAEDGSQTPIADVPFKHLDDITVSPDGRLLAFSACPTDVQCDIYTMALGSGEPIRLTQHPAQDWNPVWSPDGRFLLFLSERLGSQGDLWAVTIDRLSGSALGTPFLVKEFGQRIQGRFTLTREGELFFWWQPRLPRVFLLDVNPATGAPVGEPRTPLPNNTFAPSWVNGGSKLAYHQDAMWGDLHFYDLETARDEQIGVPGHPRASLLTPSPDGKSLAFFRLAGEGRRAIWLYQPSQEESRLFQEFEGFLNPPLMWSPDGQRLLFTVTRSGDRMAQEVLVASVSGGAPGKIAQTTGRPPFATWSPDGERVAYTDGNCIFVVPSGNHTEAFPAPRRVTCTSSSDMTDPVNFVGPMGHLTWAPYGDKLAWIVNNPRRDCVEMRIVDYATGVDMLAWSGEPNYESWPYRPSWSPAGDQIAFEVNYRRRYEVWALSGFFPKLQAH